MSEPLQELLNQLQNSTCEQLLKRIKSGEASAAEFKEAREFLKQNNIQFGNVPKEAVDLGDALPFEAPDSKDSSWKPSGVAVGES